MIDKFKEEYNRLSQIGGDDMHLFQIEDEILPFLEFATRHLGSSGMVTFMEIGLAFGGNFTLMGNCLKACAPEVLGIGVDFPVKKRWKNLDFNLEQALLRYDPHFAYELIVGKSRTRETADKVNEILCGTKLDLLFIDGDHTYRGCKGDFDLYQKIVRKNGLIVFHDIRGTKSGAFKVWEFWQEIKDDYQYIEFVTQEEDNGIGVLINK
jgi:predicted O-methyltransferase YrrM